MSVEGSVVCSAEGDVSVEMRARQRSGSGELNRDRLRGGKALLTWLVVWLVSLLLLSLLSSSCCRPFPPLSLSSRTLLPFSVHYFVNTEPSSDTTGMLCSDVTCPSCDLAFVITPQFRLVSIAAAL